MRRRRQERLVWRAGRDGQLTLFRRIWESATDGEKAELEMHLSQLRHTQLRILAIADGRLILPGLFTNTFDDEQPDTLDALSQDLQSSQQAFVSPSEYLCAIACWRRGKPYLPASKLSSHPYWPHFNEEEDISDGGRS